MKQSQGFRGFYILLHSSVYFSQPTYADKLVKVWQIQGEEIWLLIHVEIQAKSEDNFAQRMFSYNLRIFDKFAKPAISLAILCDADWTWRPNQYSYNYPDCGLHFRFGTVKLLDYQNRWTELEKSDNPFATVVMAHLKTQQTTKQLGERKTWKFSLIRRLYEQGLQERDIRNLYRFILILTSLIAHYLLNLKVAQVGVEPTTPGL